MLAALLNADLIYVGQRLWEDEALRNQAVAAAEAFHRGADGQEELTKLCTAKATAPTPRGPSSRAQSRVAPRQARQAGTEQLTLEQWSKVRECTEREIKKAVDQLTGYPIGWRWNGSVPEGQPDQDLVWAIVGIFLRVSP